MLRSELNTAEAQPDAESLDKREETKFIAFLECLGPHAFYIIAGMLRVNREGVMEVRHDSDVP